MQTLKPAVKHINLPRPWRATIHLSIFIWINLILTNMCIPPIMNNFWIKGRTDALVGRVELSWGGLLRVTVWMEAQSMSVCLVGGPAPGPCSLWPWARAEASAASQEVEAGPQALRVLGELTHWLHCLAKATEKKCPDDLLLSQVTQG